MLIIYLFWHFSLDSVKCQWKLPFLFLFPKQLLRSLKADKEVVRSVWTKGWACPQYWGEEAQPDKIVSTLGFMSVTSISLIEIPLVEEENTHHSPSFHLQPVGLWHFVYTGPETSKIVLGRLLREGGNSASMSQVPVHSCDVTSGRTRSAVAQKWHKYPLGIFGNSIGQFWERCDIPENMDLTLCYCPTAIPSIPQLVSHYTCTLLQLISF